jgi:NADH-dependent peroxiredoxin subunit F
MLDLIIIGGSAAATSAGIYAARRGLKFKIITKEFGGEIATSGEIGNWPGINQIDGISLSNKFKEHLKFYKVDIEEGVEVDKITKQDDGTFCVSTKKDGVKVAASKLPNESSEGKSCDYAAKTVIVTTGVHPRQLNLPGEKEYRNKGVSYCTTCDGPLFNGKVTAVVGGGNSALESALMLSDIASKVYVINKNNNFKGDNLLINNLSEKPRDKVEIIYGAMTKEIVGETLVTGLKYVDEAGKDQELKVDGIFVHIGMVPNSDVVPDDTEKDKFKQIIVNKNCETNIPGLYAAGDVTDISFNQIVIAAGMGSCALLSAVQYLNKLKK